MGRKGQASRQKSRPPARNTASTETGAAARGGESLTAVGTSLVNRVAERSRAWLIVACGLLWCRLLLPAESAARGDTALIVLAWCLFSGAWFWWSWRGQRSGLHTEDATATRTTPDSGPPGGSELSEREAGAAQKPGLPVDGVDLFVGVVCGTPLISGLVLCFRGGDLRAAANMSWEWLGCFLAIFWGRHLWRAAGGDLPLRLLLVMGFALSVGGIYQHHVHLPEIRARVDPLIENWRELRREAAELETKPHSEFLSQRLRERQTELERRLFREGIPTDERGQEMFVQRLHSTEPFAYFALTNTLAGLLAVCLVLLTALAMGGIRRTSGGSIPRSLSKVLGKFGGAWLVGLVLAYCLLLTKSRTGWLGALLGLGLLAVVVALASRRYRRVTLLIVGGGTLLGGLLLGLSFWLGGVDVEMFTEAEKSLRYRLEYWSASTQMLRDRWLWGVGPGNFRQNYLAYKFPESSEEILDPHAFWLDAWANGGLFCLLGMLVLLICVAWELWRGGKEFSRENSLNSGSSTGEDAAAASSAESSGASSISREVVPLGQQAESLPSQLQPLPTLLSSEVERAGLLGLKAPLVGLGLIGLFALLLASPRVAGLFEEILLTQLLAAGGLLLLIKLPPLSGGLRRLACAASALGLTLHLLGAGGFSMPVILQMLLLLGITFHEAAGPRWVLPVRRYPMFAGGALLLTGIGWWGVIQPDLAAVEAEANLVNSRSARESLVAIRQWTKADRLSPDSWWQRSQLERAEAERTQDADLLRASIQSLQQSIFRDPQNYSGYRQWARLEALLAEWRDDAQAWEQAVQAQREAIARYPHLANLHVELARYLVETGAQPEAVEAARRALQLHEINVQAGHPDRLLPAADLDWLKNLLESSENSNE